MKLHFALRVRYGITKFKPDTTVTCQIPQYVVLNQCHYDICIVDAVGKRAAISLKAKRCNGMWDVVATFFLWFAVGLSPPSANSCQFHMAINQHQHHQLAEHSARRLQSTWPLVGCAMVRSERPGGTAPAADGLPTGGAEEWYEMVWWGHLNLQRWYEILQVLSNSIFHFTWRVMKHWSYQRVCALSDLPLW